MEQPIPQKNIGFLIASLLCFAVTAVLIFVLVHHISIVIPERPDMGSPNWFNESRRVNELMFGKTTGIILSIFGMIVSVILGIVFLTRYNTPQGFMQSGADRVASAISTIREAIVPPKKEPEKVYCEYCKSFIEEGSNFCDACGSRRRGK